MAISTDELINKYEKIELDETELKIANTLIEEIDKSIELDYIEYKLKNYTSSSSMDGFKCPVYIWDFKKQTNKLSSLSKKRIEIYIFQKYINGGWEIINNRGVLDWDIKFNLAKLREKNIDNLLED